MPIAPALETAIANLFSSLGQHPEPPAPLEQIAQFEKRNKLKLPSDVRALLAVTNGSVLRANNLRLLSLTEAQDWLDGWTADWPKRWAYFPFAEDFDGNAFCVCCKSPIKGLVVRTPHDDVPGLHCRSLASWLVWVASFSTDEDWAMLSKPADFDSTIRTKKDLSMAIKLQAIEKFASEADEADVNAFAICLLSEAGLSILEEKLRSDNIFIAEAAEGPLRQMKSAAAKRIIDAFDQEMAAFVKACIAYLESSGHGIAAAYQGAGAWTHLNVSHQNKRSGLTAYYFFARRNEPGILEEVLGRSCIALRIAEYQYSERAMAKIAEFLNDSDTQNRFEIENLLRQIGTPQAQAAIADHRERLRLFGEEAANFLQQNGIQARYHGRDETAESPILSISNEADSAKLFVPKYFHERNRENHWSFLLRDATEALAVAAKRRETRLVQE